VESFFRKVGNDRHPVSSLVITHLLAERPAFLRAIARVCKVVAVLPKPKSVDDGALRLVQAVMPVDSLDRQRFTGNGSQIPTWRWSTWSPARPVSGSSCWMWAATSPRA
jgi:hypothetical protein